ncbi:MAG TPA: DHA2 family efflux MFS transporter permease subunit [Acidimicrobiia bacterium]|nr:DHA2 family efflux MFS transporter permease subunit [Acidimicrobiia bacterium]
MHGRPAPQVLGESSPSHPNRWRILGVLVLALLVTSIDHTIINVALPQLVGDLGASAAALQWIVAAYTVVFAGLLLTAGSLGDRFGRRRALAVGLFTFLAGSVLSAVAASTTMLIVGRGVMGVGGALIMPTTLSILVNSFGDPRERAKAIAIWTAASGAGIALGPIVGGLLMRSFSWSSVFWINVPLLAVAFVGTLHLVPESRDPNATRLDPIGALLSTAAIGTLVYAIIEGPEQGWTSRSTLTGVAFAAFAGAVFARWEMRRDDPMLDIRLFANRGFSGGSVALAMLFFAMAGAVFLQAQYLQFILDYTPLVAGFALVPAAVGMIVGTGAGAHLAANLGGRVAVVTGTLFAAGGVAVQAAFIDGTSYVPTGLGLLLFGLGAGIAMPAATELIMSTLPPARAGIGSAVNDTVRELGGALGVAVIGSVAASTYASNLNGDLDRIPGLTDNLRAALTDNVGAAIGASEQLGTNGAEVAQLARDAFVSSMSGALWVAVGLAVWAAVIAIVHLPRPGASVDIHIAHGDGVDHDAAVPVVATAHHAGLHRSSGGVRHTVTTVVAIAALAVGLAACGDDSTATSSATSTPAPAESSTTAPTVERPTALVDASFRIEAGQMHLRCVGSGSTTVLLIAGWGDGGESWGAVEPAIAERARVCSYARFGTGTSDAPATDQTFATQAADLHELLEEAGEPGPYVVLGHSFGGAEGVTFASEYPDEVVGLMLLDTTPPTWPEAVCAVVDDGSEAARTWLEGCAVMRDPSKDPERVDVFAAFAEVAEIGSLGDLPMTVMSADRRTLPALAAAEVTRLNAVWDDGVESWEALSTVSNVVLVEDSGHYIQVEHPDVVIDELLALVP